MKCGMYLSMLNVVFSRKYVYTMHFPTLMLGLIIYSGTSE